MYAPNGQRSSGQAANILANNNQPGDGTTSNSNQPPKLAEVFASQLGRDSPVFRALQTRMLEAHEAQGISKMNAGTSNAVVGSLVDRQVGTTLSNNSKKNNASSELLQTKNAAASGNLSLLNV
ncbi:unnamed protein product, partial [Amoebophrya sp. A120]|eukprot:GSA120T00016152001.1